MVMRAKELKHLYISPYPLVKYPLNFINRVSMLAKFLEIPECPIKCGQIVSFEIRMCNEKKTFLNETKLT